MNLFFIFNHNTFHLLTIFYNFKFYISVFFVLNIKTISCYPQPHVHFSSNPFEGWFLSPERFYDVPSCGAHVGIELSSQTVLAHKNAHQSIIMGFFIKKFVLGFLIHKLTQGELSFTTILEVPKTIKNITSKKLMTIKKKTSSERLSVKHLIQKYLISGDHEAIKCIATYLYQNENSFLEALNAWLNSHIKLNHTHIVTFDAMTSPSEIVLKNTTSCWDVALIMQYIMNHKIQIASQLMLPNHIDHKNSDSMMLHLMNDVISNKMFDFFKSQGIFLDDFLWKESPSLSMGYGLITAPFRDQGRIIWVMADIPLKSSHSLEKKIGDFNTMLKTTYQDMDLFLVAKAQEPLVRIPLTSAVENHLLLCCEKDFWFIWKKNLQGFSMDFIYYDILQATELEDLDNLVLGYIHYGDRETPHIFYEKDLISKKSPSLLSWHKRWFRHIKMNLKKGINVIIPVFSFPKAQILFKSIKNTEDRKENYAKILTRSDQ